MKVYQTNIFLFLHKNICCGYRLEVPIHFYWVSTTYVFMQKQEKIINNFCLKNVFQYCMCAQWRLRSAQHAVWSIELLQLFSNLKIGTNVTGNKIVSWICSKSCIFQTIHLILKNYHCSSRVLQCFREHAPGSVRTAINCRSFCTNYGSIWKIANTEYGHFFNQYCVAFLVTRKSAMSCLFLDKLALIRSGSVPQISSLFSINTQIYLLKKKLKLNL